MASMVKTPGMTGAHWENCDVLLPASVAVVSVVTLTFSYVSNPSIQNSTVYGTCDSHCNPSGLSPAAMISDRGLSQAAAAPITRGRRHLSKTRFVSEAAAGWDNPRSWGCSFAALCRLRIDYCNKLRCGS